jgi:hypothetical protein
MFYPAANTVALSTGGSERIRVDSSGNVGIGVTSPTQKLDIDNGANSAVIKLTGRTGKSVYLAQDSVGATVYQEADAPLYFGTNNAERARITSGGYFKASNTGTYADATGAFHEFYQTTSNIGVALRATNASFSSNVIDIRTTRAASSAYIFITGIANGTEQFTLRGDGVILAQNTTVQSISDARVKENVTDAAEGLGVINALRPVRFDFKEGFGNNRKHQLGFIAQEVEPVFPDAIDVSGQSDENGDPYKTVGPAALIPVLVKAIQELKAINDAQAQRIETLEAKVAALEGAE